VHVAINDQQIDVEQGQTCSEALAQVLSKKKLKQAIACKCDDTLLDLSRQVPSGCSSIQPVYPDTPEGLHVLRHSAAHLMAQAVKKLFPSAKVTIGPAIENGFYYDFDFERSFTPDDLKAIEEVMQKSVEADLPFERREMSKDQARKLFSMDNETYKLELLDDMEDDRVSIYTQGTFTDLCRGPHVPSTGCLGSFKLTSVAGAYWRGDENKPMLQRIYGTAWPTRKELKNYLNRLEEAKKRDHRKLGAQLDLFHFSEEAGPGMPLFHPKGAPFFTPKEPCCALSWRISKPGSISSEVTNWFADPSCFAWRCGKNPGIMTIIGKTCISPRSTIRSTGSSP